MPARAGRAALSAVGHAAVLKCAITPPIITPVFAKSFPKATLRRQLFRCKAIVTTASPHPDNPLRNVRTNIVQSIRAFRVPELQDAARQLGQHFLYANLAGAQTKQDVLDMIAEQFTLPAHFGKNFDALYDCITDPLHKSGPQPGFIVVLEQIPTNARFDKETREQLLDIFREAADYWNDRKVAFRCFYSFL